jgi:hypothetical protein
MHMFCCCFSVRYRNTQSVNSDSRQAVRKILCHRLIKCPRGTKKRMLLVCIRGSRAPLIEKARDITRSLILRGYLE